MHFKIIVSPTFQKVEPYTGATSYPEDPKNRHVGFGYYIYRFSSVCNDYVKSRNVIWVKIEQSYVHNVNHMLVCQVEYHISKKFVHQVGDALLDNLCYLVRTKLSRAVIMRMKMPSVLNQNFSSLQFLPCSHKTNCNHISPFFRSKTLGTWLSRCSFTTLNLFFWFILGTNS